MEVGFFAAERGSNFSQNAVGSANPNKWATRMRLKRQVKGKNSQKIRGKTSLLWLFSLLISRVLRHVRASSGFKKRRHFGFTFWSRDCNVCDQRSAGRYTHVSSSKVLEYARQGKVHYRGTCGYAFSKREIVYKGCSLHNWPVLPPFLRVPEKKTLAAKAV